MLTPCPFHPTLGLRGAIPYAPPEVYLETLYDPVPVDIFALAILFCEITEPGLPWKRRVWPDWERDSFSLFRHDATLKQRRHSANKSHGSGRRAISGDEHPNDVPMGGRNFPFLAYEAWETEVHRATMDSLVTLLPAPSRPIIRWMLEPDPNMRATWMDIWSDGWIQSLKETC
ncbi:Nitrogen permease reactivator protein [Rhinocladiella similis]